LPAQEARVRSDPDIVLPEGPDADPWYRAASRTAAVAAAFCGAVLFLLLANAHLLKRDNPLNHPEAAASMARLSEAAKARDAAAVQERIEEFRRLDARLRDHYFRGQAAANRGFGLLLAGLAVFLLASKAAGLLRRREPAPGASLSDWAVGRDARRLVALVVLLVALALLLAAGAAPPALPP
jgi:hypothetical protein